ncbi:MAG: DUF4105 domain-containing protein [Pseudoxanthomonas sp.]
MTMAPGDVFFERFGHDAIVVVDETTGAATSYNFGAFDPTEADFMGRFARGEMMYYLVAMPLEQDLAYYREVGRGAQVQWLDLPPQQLQALADLLAEEARPENARYAYDYFTNNCATRVRDAIDEALGGALKRQMSARSRGNSFRSESVRLASPAAWMWIGFDLGLGPYADKPLTRWDEAFVPMRLADSLREAKNNDGRPLVQQQIEVLPHRIAPEPAEQPRRWWPWLLAGLTAAGLIVFFARRQPRLLAALLLPFWLLCGVGGALLLYLWGFTEHRAAWANQNLLLLNPLCLALLPAGWAWLRGKETGAWSRRIAAMVAVAAFAAWFLHWLPFVFPFQENRAWIALLLPVHVAVAYVFRKR